MNRILLSLLLTLIVAVPLAAQDTTTATARWTVDDILLAESAGSYEISPDGRWVVWVRSAMDEEDGRRASNLWITRLSDGESWPLTRGSENHSSPTWSPDGQYIAFSSGRPVPGADDEDGGGSQIWLIRVAGGEPWPITTKVRGLRGFEWRGGSADSIVFAAQEIESQFEREREEDEDDAFAVEDPLEEPPMRLWSVAIESKKVRRLTSNDDWIQSFAVSPDGQWAVTRNGQSLSYSFDARIPPETHLVNLATGERRAIIEDERMIPGSLQWSRDGSGFYFSYDYSSHPIYTSASVTRMAFFDVAVDQVVPIDLEWENGLGGGFEVVPGGFVAQLADGVHNLPALYIEDGNGWRRTMIEGAHVPQIWDMSVSEDGEQIAYTMSDASIPPQPYIAELDGSEVRSPEQFAELNPSFAKKPIPRSEIVHWTGALDEQVEGILFYPLDYDPNRKYPLIVSIHGGPASADRDEWSQSWSYPTVLFNQKGAFVFNPNYHGSAYYGLDWVESIGGGKYYELEIPDIQAGVDYLIDRGLVAPDSIATHGWSNGAILSTALTVEDPERYKASVAGAGDVEWISDWANVDFGASFDNYYFGASPFEDPQLYIEKSPFFRMDEVRTPTLIFFGTEDRNVPPSQGWSHFRALQQFGNVPVRFVLFPGQPHGLGKLAYQRRKVNEEFRWYERYLWDEPDTVNLAIAEDSPLTGLLGLAEAAREGHLYGVRTGDILAPEVVEQGDLRIGRFEVTRAQWQAFDPSYEFEPGTGNYPVNGISFEGAREYAAWLADRTGQPYRLATEAELEPLANSADAGNTLDYWAGYTANPDDVVMLHEALGRLPGDAPLLRAVGSFPDDRTRLGVFDLGGNVAEWVVEADGTGTLVGGSADRSTDPRAREAAAAPEYRGVRIVADGPLS